MTHTLPPNESLTVEFKSDRVKLSDKDLVEAIICLANTEGGELWLGVEDDGTLTGLHADDGPFTHFLKASDIRFLCAAIRFYAPLCAVILIR